MREQGLSLLATDSILALGLVTNAASFASTPAEKLAPLIADLIAALKSLPPQDHYPLVNIDFVLSCVVNKQIFKPQV